MNDFFPAFEMGPTSERGARAVAPEIFRGIYAMPAFVTIPTDDLDASVDFWLRGLGFIELFRMPGVVHLRRWAFQDVLLVPGEPDGPEHPPAMSVSFSYVLSELDGVAEACAELRPGSTTGPRDTPWLTRDVEVITPEGARVICTAPREFDPSSAEAQSLAAAGIPVPGTDEEGDNGHRG
ncbi:VOC family protein [Microbacterium sp. XT11]|uniref:VOC family protein n=1 Tax=Microbacterium sp. XT11 TaxID=367477 RepID=UPI000742FF51|nr:VOC family protein [Microbacterium sp. XT11]ALX65849.1 glycosyltransferase [Microbacterium sp. XT11]